MRDGAAHRAAPLVLLLASLCVVSGCSREPRGPNLLLVTVATLRPDFLGTYGLTLGVSPNLDELAGRSIVFDRAIAASTRTAPSHASIMTSRFVREHSIGSLNGMSRLGGERTLAMALKGAGYDTAAFVGNVMLERRMGLDGGFDVYDDDLPEEELNRPYFLERNAEATTQRVLEWLARERTRPFFLWVHYQDPHGPYTPPAPFDEIFQSDPDLEEESLPVLEAQEGQNGIPAYQLVADQRRPSQYVSRYMGEIRYFDHWLGKLLTAVPQEPRGTAILLTSDHGESMGEDGWYFTHGNRTTPEQSRVPFLLYAPDLSPGRRSELVHHVDVMPTLLEIAGLPVPESSRGIAIAPRLRGEVPFSPRIVYTDVGSQVSAYNQNLFVRLERVKQSDQPGRHSWRSLGSFHWLADGGWERAEDDARMEAALKGYLRQQVSVVRIDALKPVTLERLQALGHVDP